MIRQRIGDGWRRTPPSQRAAWLSVTAGFAVTSVTALHAIDRGTEPPTWGVLASAALLLWPATVLAGRSGYWWVLGWTVLLTTNASRAHDDASWHLPAYVVTLALFFGGHRLDARGDEHSRSGT